MIYIYGYFGCLLSLGVMSRIYLLRASGNISNNRKKGGSDAKHFAQKVHSVNTDEPVCNTRYAGIDL